MSMMPNQQQTEEEMLMQLYAQQQAANQYGSGTDAMMEADSNPYARPQARLNYWQDIEALTGVPFVQLSGVGAAPQDPANAPNIFQSDVGAAYRSNPVFADAFDLIDQGVDPYKAMAAVQSAFDAGEYGEQGTMLVPQKMDEFTNTVSGPDWDEVAGTVQQYATDQARTQRETEQYNMTNGPAYSSVQKDGARYANAPLGGNDPFAWANEGDLYDWDALQGDADALKAGFAGSRDMGPKPSDVPEGPRPSSGPGFIPGGPQWEGPLGPQSRQLQASNVTGDYGPADARHKPRTAPRISAPPQSGPARRQASASKIGGARQSLIGAETGAFDKSLQANIDNRRSRANQTMVRSDANANAMARLKAAYTMLMGQ